MNKIYKEEQIKIKKRIEESKKKPFFDSQGFNVINMKYSDDISGQILKNKDNIKAQTRFRRAKNLFIRNNTQYDILTGK